VYENTCSLGDISNKLAFNFTSQGALTAGEPSNAACKRLVLPLPGNQTRADEGGINGWVDSQEGASSKTVEVWYDTLKWICSPCEMTEEGICDEDVRWFTSVTVAIITIRNRQSVQ
jgi:hypothetical protein